MTLGQFAIYYLYNYWWVILLAWVLGYLIKASQKQSRNVKDTRRYADIQDVIKKYGTPDDIKEYGDYVKYTFRRSTNGWGHNKYGSRLV